MQLVSFINQHQYTVMKNSTVFACFIIVLGALFCFSVAQAATVEAPALAGFTVPTSSDVLAAVSKDRPRRGKIKPPPRHSARNHTSRNYYKSNRFKGRRR
ncbi:MAG: hypothetical protein HY22_06805 [[Candidatus Thermochlorobacteriaceae] bacterium GBChlB]|nr:MAG: hypothetical protein HY22_06805 [[Candidatus Thermochlorobacteriaceae] bacterium GBChlB]